MTDNHNFYCYVDWVGSSGHPIATWRGSGVQVPRSWGSKSSNRVRGSLPFLYKSVPDFRKVRMPYNIGVRTFRRNQLHPGEIQLPAEKAKICPRWRHSGMRTFWDFPGSAQLCPKIPSTESGQFAVLGLSLDIGLGRFYGAGDAQKKKIGEKWKK